MRRARGHARPSVTARRRKYLSARVVGWPAPPAESPSGVYAVKICGLDARGARLAAERLARHGLRTSSFEGAVIVEGPSSRFATLAREAPGPRGEPREALSAASGAVARFRDPPLVLYGRARTLDLRRPLIVGILNATPDSFYDRGRYFAPRAAIARARRMVAEGADLIEVGGETARPGPRVSAEEETRRVVPLVEALVARLPVPVSVDTFKPVVARHAVEAGAVLINDISGLRDLRMAEVAAASGAALVVMHIQGRPKVRQRDPRYRSVVDEVYAFLEARTAAAVAAGVPRTSLVIDPGFSFGKAVHHDVEVLRRLGEFRSLGFPIYLATSRKNFIRDVLGLPVEDLLEGTAAAVAYGVAQGAHLVRTHDVKFMARLVRMVQVIVHSGAAGDGNGRLGAAEVNAGGQS